jgi:hypothetical protein
VRFPTTKVRLELDYRIATLPSQALYCAEQKFIEALRQVRPA